jgi:hypothetical protein
MTIETDWTRLLSIEDQIHRLGRLDTGALPRKKDRLTPDPPSPAPDWQEASEDFVLQAPDSALEAPVLGLAPAAWRQAARKFEAGYSREEVTDSGPSPSTPTSWPEATRGFVAKIQKEENHEF